MITADASGHVKEFANLQPLCSGRTLNQCLYMGLAAQFVPVRQYYDARGILMLDVLPIARSILVGYIYGGLTLTQQNIFTNDVSVVTNQVYGVYVTTSANAVSQWQDITNAFSN